METYKGMLYLRLYDRYTGANEKDDKKKRQINMRLVAKYKMRWPNTRCKSSLVDYFPESSFLYAKAREVAINRTERVAEYKKRASMHKRTHMLIPAAEKKYLQLSWQLDIIWRMWKAFAKAFRKEEEKRIQGDPRMVARLHYPSPCTETADLIDDLPEGAITVEKVESLELDESTMALISACEESVDKKI